MTAMQIHKDQFQQWMAEGKTVLVDYWAPWCGYCRRIGPAYDKIAEEYGDQLVVAKVNIDEEPQLTEAQGVEAIPTLILYKNGKASTRWWRPNPRRPSTSFCRTGWAGKEELPWQRAICMT